MIDEPGFFKCPNCSSRNIGFYTMGAQCADCNYVLKEFISEEVKPDVVIEKE